MNRLLLFIICFIQSLISFGQKGYYSTDSTVSVGVEIVDRGRKQNAEYCQIIKNNKPVSYSPSEVKEYGFKNGTTYVSKQIWVNGVKKDVFLERLCQGDIILYYYKGKDGQSFYIEPDSLNLIKLIKKEKQTGQLPYKDTLSTYFENCKEYRNALKYIHYRRMPLTKIIDAVNICDYKPFPFKKVGLIAGLDISKPINAKNDLKGSEFKNDYAFLFGVFLDIPIAYSYFSFHPEIYFHKKSFSSHTKLTNKQSDIIINTSGFSIPVLLKYTSPTTSAIKPFANLGAIFTYNFRNENAVYSANITDDVIEINETDNSVIFSKQQTGYVLGGGAQLSISPKRSISIELRFSQQFDLQNAAMGTQSFIILAGINF